jgi:hypothetical protein
MVSGAPPHPEKTNRQSKDTPRMSRAPVARGAFRFQRSAAIQIFFWKNWWR